MTNDTSPTDGRLEMPVPMMVTLEMLQHPGNRAVVDAYLAATGVPDDNDYSPMTANEAGEQRNDEFDAAVSRTVDWSPSKPLRTHDGRIMDASDFSATSHHNSCTEHCFCVEDNTHMLVPRCCWCADPKPQTQRVPGHGPFRSELVRE